MENKDFARLISDVRSNDEAAATKLIEHFGPILIVMVRRRLGRQLRLRYQSDDFTQNVWASLFAHRDRLDGIETPEALATFLATLVRNKIVSSVRRELMTDKRRISLEDDGGGEGMGELAGREASPSKLAVAEETWQLMLDQASPQGKRILELRRQGMKIVEIAAELTLNERTVRRLFDRLKIS